MSLIYFKINSENIVTDAVYLNDDTYPDEKYKTDGIRPLTEEEHGSVPVNTWIDTDTTLLRQRGSQIINDINGCVYEPNSKTFSRA